MHKNSEEPIYDSMFKAGITSSKIFNICLGKNGGYFQVGGYNTDKHLEPVKWFDFAPNSGTSYMFKL